MHIKMEANMPAYSLPREAFNLLLEIFGEPEKAEKFARAMESAIEAMTTKPRSALSIKKK